MYTQKLYKNGNSVAVTIPKKFLQELNLRDGSQVVVEKQDQRIVLKAKKDLSKPALTPEFHEWLKKINEEYGSALEELAKK